eukprot:gnl/TRDRNA2_/TRDRNA2_144445_c0_seq1.p1 gnl/TRDRNA2_/TRDRNA2_144445_c0~~gnl/TRDRNA2_/TRDRNA2_144445_c0_seq1.p1  ORF type:complete len:364 (-),score=38.22 gnl/TRDRNA2_/TRDRNA2_144445_c0_seq1:37-1128(-)
MEVLSRSYLEGMAWIWKYYSSGIPSWSWHFAYHRPPLMSDFVRFLAHQPNGKFAFTLGRPLESVSQLLCVLPPQSFGLLPQHIEQRLQADPMMLQDYPEQFSEDCVGKAKRWQTVPLIPFVNVSRVKLITCEASFAALSLSPQKNSVQTQPPRGHTKQMRAPKLTAKPIVHQPEGKGTMPQRAPKPTVKPIVQRPEGMGTMPHTAAKFTVKPVQQPEGTGTMPQRVAKFTVKPIVQQQEGKRTASWRSAKPTANPLVQTLPDGEQAMPQRADRPSHGAGTPPNRWTSRYVYRQAKDADSRLGGHSSRYVYRAAGAQYALLLQDHVDDGVPVGLCTLVFLALAFVSLKACSAWRPSTRVQEPLL